MMVLPVSSQSKKPLPSAVDKCRYVRTINLLSGVARISDKRGKRVLRKQRKKKGQLLVWFIKGSANIRYVYCMEIGVMRTVLLFLLL